ncbi:MAG: SRPBCC family protein [Acidobacteria bacterium]|nr:SRPBCC family protein [Acidobacteriota bacterium]
MSIAAGLAAAAMCARRTSSSKQPWRWLATGLITRGTTGLCPVNYLIGRGASDEPRIALSGSGGVKIRERIVIRKPIEPLFEFWRDLRNLPHVLSHVEHVDVLDNDRSHWVVRGPAGVRLAWDAETINEVRPTLLAWKSLPGSDVVSAGSVRFRALSPAATALTITLQYEPPAGKVGASLAWLAGQGPAAMLRKDLRRMKQLLEKGTVDEGRSGRAVSTPRPMAQPDMQPS